MGLFHMDAQSAILPEVTLGGTKMKRDMDLVAKILDQTEKRVEREVMEVVVEGYDKLTVGTHVAMLFDCKYLDGIAYDFESPFKVVMVRDLTWEGHEFLAALRNEHGWAAMKKAMPAAELAKLPLRIIQKVATAAIEKWAMNQLGL